MSNISRRSFMAASSATLLSVLLAGCDNGSQEPAAEGGDDAAQAGGKHIYVLTASPDHGWTGQVGVFAQ